MSIKIKYITKTLAYFKVFLMIAIITISMNYNVAFAGAPGNPPSNNVSAPLNINNFKQEKLGPLYLSMGLGLDSIGLLVNGISKFYGDMEIGTATTPASLKIIDGNQGNGKVLTSDANGNAGWRVPDPSGMSKVIVCSKSVDVTGQLVRTDHTINFSASDCTGGVLPDEKYVGSLKKLGVCWGFTNVTVNDKTATKNPGITYYGNSIDTTRVYDAAGCRGVTPVFADIAVMYVPRSNTIAPIPRETSCSISRYIPSGFNFYTTTVTGDKIVVSGDSSLPAEFSFTNDGGTNWTSYSSNNNYEYSSLSPGVYDILMRTRYLTGDSTPVESSCGSMQIYNPLVLKSNYSCKRLPTLDVNLAGPTKKIRYGIVPNDYDSARVFSEWSSGPMMSLESFVESVLGPPVTGGSGMNEYSVHFFTSGIAGTGSLGIPTLEVSTSSLLSLILLDTTSSSLPSVIIPSSSLLLGTASVRVSSGGYSFSIPCN